VSTPPEIRQEETSVARNREFFAGERWSQQISEIDTYRLIRKAIEAELAGTEKLLDVGNGGVFEYSPGLVESIVAVDLFLSDIPAEEFPENVVARNGDALSLSDEPNDAYDAVLHSFLYHHLVGNTPRALLGNVRRAIAEAERVLRPGGRLIVPEGCVPRWFYAVERAAFRPLVGLSKTRLLGGHPATLLMPFEDVASLVGERLEIVRAERIPVGRWVSHFGRRWPAALTPARPYILVAVKR
jgi:SAM-dependent methyltransferase